MSSNYACIVPTSVEDQHEIAWARSENILPKFFISSQYLPSETNRRASFSTIMDIRLYDLRYFKFLSLRDFDLYQNFGTNAFSDDTIDRSLLHYFASGLRSLLNDSSDRFDVEAYYHAINHKSRRHRQTKGESLKTQE